MVLIAVQMTASLSLTLFPLSPQGDNFQCVAAAAVGLEVGTIPIVRPATAEAGEARKRSAVRERGKGREAARGASRDISK